MHFLPAPTFVLLCQLGISSLVVKVCDSLGYLEADKFEWEKVRPMHGGVKGQWAWGKFECEGCMGVPWIFWVFP